MTAEEFYNRFEFNPSVSGSLLGRGGFSSVHKVYDKVRKRYVAVKRSEVGVYQKFDLEREVKLAHEIDIHPNIMRYENVYRISDRAGVFDYAIMKFYAEGNLDDVLRKYQLNETERKHILKGMLKGLAHLHQVPIIHRDFKAANVLMDRDIKGSWVPIITDFGLSRLIDPDMSYVSNNSQIAHAPNYVAPEQLLDNAAIRPNTDLWAFGVITYKMLTGRLPFRVEGVKGEWDISNKLRSLILENRLPADINTLPEPYKSIILRCLVTDPEKRIKDAEEVLRMLDKRRLPTAPLSPPVIPSSIGDQTEIFIAPEEPISAPKVVEPEAVKQPKSLPPPKKLSWNWLVFGGIGVILLGGLGYWLINRPKPKEVISPSMSVETDTVVKTVRVIKKDTLSPKIQLPKNSQKETDFAESKKVKEREEKPIAKGYLIVETVHDMNVYIDGQLQPKTAMAGFKNKYVLPATSQGILLKVERLDLPVSRSESITIVAGKTTVRKYDD